MAVYNELNRPRAVVAGCGAEHPLVQAIDGLVGWYSIVVVDRQPLHERDVVIVWQEAANSGNAPVFVGGGREKHLRVLQFGGSPTTTWRASARSSIGPRVSTSLGDELHIPDSCPANLRGLVKDTLIPLLASRGSSRWVLENTWEGETPTTFIPLLTTSSGCVLAAIYSHPDIAEAWWLPIEPDDDTTFDFAAWVSAALDAWHIQDADRFPGPADWTRSKEWMTREELQLQVAVEQVQAELEQQQVELGEKIAAAESALAEAQARHDTRERILLTGQGDELVDAVHSMLGRLGFDVEDVDKKRAAEDRESRSRPRPKLEDLQVSDPETSWRALAEIKGYVGGGKTSDFQKINRFVGIYQAQNSGSLPDATWYVVNQFLSTPPDTRPQLMEGQAEDVEVFVESVNGVLIDTRDLFVLDRRVAAGEITREAAREMLMSAKLRFSLDAGEDSGGDEEDYSTGTPTPPGEDIPTVDSQP